MLNVEDTVKVKGTTLSGGIEKELILIGTICRVIEISFEPKNGPMIMVVPETELPYNGYNGYWYLACDVEKGHTEWVKDE